MVLGDDGGDVLALEPGAGLAQRRAQRGARVTAAFEAHVVEQRLERDGALGRGLHEAVEEVPQLARVAMPRHGGQERQGAALEHLLGHLALAAGPGDEELRQAGNVRAALPERRQLDPELGEAAMQIQADPALIHERLAVGVGGGHGARGEREGLAAEALGELAVPEERGQARLDARGQLLEAPEEDGAAERLVEQRAGVDDLWRARRPRPAIPVAAAGHAENQALRLGGRQRLAVDGDEGRAVRTGAGVDGPRDEPPPGAGLAGDHHADARGGGLLHEADDVAHEEGLDDDPGIREALVDGHGGHIASPCDLQDGAALL